MSKFFVPMKKLALFIAVLFCFTGCSLDDGNNTTFTYELVPTLAVEIPDTLFFQNTYAFEVTYERPTNCHFFDGFSFEINENERIIGVVNGVYENPDCEPSDTLTGIVNLNFVVKRNDFYIFKFWQGNDEDGEPIFLTKEVPVKTE